MSKVDRSCIVVGNGAVTYSVECAIRADGSSPAREFLDELKAGAWSESEEPSDEQVSLYHRLVDVMKHMGETGSPYIARRDLNYLHDGIWEFRAATLRLAFYDTPGDGTYTAKGKVARVDSAYPDDDDYWVPDFDSTLRLANAWPKTGDYADALDIDEAIAIRGEDLAHDNEE